jgi:hypothetical protein
MMSITRSSVNGALLKVIPGFVIVLLVLVGLEVKGFFTPRAFAIIVSTVAFIAWIILTWLLQRAHKKQG